MRTIGTSVDAIESSLYLGLAQYGRKRYSNARTLLRSFAKSTLPDPIPDAHYLAWSILAELDRAAEDPFFERESVYAALQNAPPGEKSKIFWQRLGELQMADGHTSSSLPLRSFSEAISHSTEVSPKLMARFENLGKRARQDEGRDMGLIYQELVRERRSLPPIPLNIFDLLTLAKMHAASGNDLAVVSVCRRILDNLPGFSPAVDLMINARLALGRDRSAIAQIVERMDATGLDEVSIGFLQRLPRDPFSTEQLHRVMRADPAFTGKLEVARRLRAVGDREAALACLIEKGADLSPEEALLAARIHAELGQREAAKKRLSSIQASDPSYPQAMLLYGRLGSITNDTVAIDVSVDALLATKNVSNIQALVKQLLFDRKLERVAPALAALTELSGESDPWVLEHYVLYRLVRGEAVKAREAASRAEFFSLSHQAPMGMILASTIEPDRAQAVKNSALFLGSFPNAVNPIARAAIALLANRPALAKELLENEGSAEERAPEWALITVAAEALGHDIGMNTLSDNEVSHARGLLLGSADKPRDPVTSLGVLLSAQTQFFAPYALEKLNEYAGQERDAWSSYLIASTLKRGNELGRARDAIWTAAQEKAQYFRPARDLFEDLEHARLGSLDHPDIDALRLSALRAKARLDADSVAALLVKAHDALNASHTNAANAACLEAMGRAPLDHEVQATMALVKLSKNDYRLSLNHWIKACETAPSSHLQSYVSKSLQCIEDALAFTPPRLLPSDASGALSMISSYATSDPRIPLLMAKLDLLKDPNNPATGVSRAFLRLENYTSKNRKTGVADLRPGTEEDWIAFYMDHGPRQALDFCRQQLRLSPGSYSLWLGEVRALRALSHPREALIAAKVLLKINATPELHEEIAACLQESGRPAQEVERELAKAFKARGGTLSVDGILTRTKSLLSVHGERAASQAIASLSRAWDQSATGPMNEQQSEVGLILAEGFLKRDQRGDLRSAKVLLEEVSKRGMNPYARSLANALAGLCEQS
jgi:hypothetical protein